MKGRRSLVLGKTVFALLGFNALVTEVATLVAGLTGPERAVRSHQRRQLLIEVVAVPVARQRADVRRPGAD